jgi:hypothetical protein
LTLDEKREVINGNPVDAERYATLKNIYGRIAWLPWESLPPDTPNSINPEDLRSLSASEIEEMVAVGFDDKPPDAPRD